MDNYTSDIALASSNLAAIKYCIVWILVLLVVIVLSNLIRSYFYIKNELSGINKNNFTDKISELIDKDELDKAKEILIKKISTHPNHAYANYYLARVYLLENNHSKCASVLEKLVKIQPDWKDSYVDQIFKYINEKKYRKLLTKVSSRPGERRGNLSISVARSAHNSRYTSTNKSS